MAGFIEDTFQKMQNAGDSYVSSAYQQLSQPVLTTLKVLFVIMIAWYGYQMLMGRATVSLSEIARRVGWMVVIIAALQAFATYRLFIFEIVTKVPETVGQLLFKIFDGAGGGSGSGGNVQSGLQKVWDTGFQAVSAAYAKAGITSLGAFLIALMLAVGTIFFVCIGVFVIGVAKILAFVLLALGPLFIGLAVFQWSRSWTFSWLNMLFNAMCLLMVGYAVIGFFLGIANLAVNSTAAASSDLSLALKEVSQFCFFCFLGGVVFIQVPQVAAGLAGGLSISGVGAGFYAMRSTRMAARQGMTGAGNAARWNLRRQERVRQARLINMSQRSSGDGGLTTAQATLRDRLSR